MGSVVRIGDFDDELNSVLKRWKAVIRKIEILIFKEVK